MSGPRIIFRCLMLLVLLPVGCGTTLAQEFRVRSYVQPDRGLTDTDPFRLVIQVEGEGQPNVVPPDMRGLVNLKVIGGPSTNSSFTWRNGVSSANFQLIYTLLAAGPGEAEVPAIAINVKGKTYKTEPIRLQIAASSGGGAGPPATPQTRPSVPSRGNPRGATEDVDVFLTAELGSKEVWVGQTVPLNLTLYAAQTITGFEWVERPDAGNFWVEQLEVDADAESYETRVNNRSYRAFPIERNILIPPVPGEYDLDPYIVQLQVRVASSDPFDIFSRRRSKTIVRKTEPLKLIVKPLPSGAPDDFSGAVGQFSLRVALDREEAQVNDAVAMKATVRGKGSLKSVSAPKLRDSSDLKILDPKINESYKTSAGVMTSTRSWEWVIVPLIAGEVSLPAVRFSYFNPATEQYETAGGGELKLAVLKSADGAAAPLARRGIQVQRRELNFIKSLRGELREKQPRLHERLSFRALLMLPFALLPLAIVLGRQQARYRRDHGLARGRRARSRARKRFRQARSHIDDPDANFHEEVARTLVGYVADHFNRSAAGLTYDIADELLSSKKIDADLRRRFRSCLEACDFARYVPASTKSERRQEVLDEASAIVEQLEGAW